VDVAGSARARHQPVEEWMKGPPRTMDGWAICWRASPRLSVSAFATMLRPGQLSEVAQAVTEVWARQ
jgi:hypothetical protein